MYGTLSIVTESVMYVYATSTPIHYADTNALIQPLARLSMVALHVMHERKITLSHLIDAKELMKKEMTNDGPMASANRNELGMAT